MRLLLFALAYDLDNFLRRLVPSRPMKTWTMTTLLEKQIKIGAKVVRHAKYVTFQMGKIASPWEGVTLLDGGPAAEPGEGQMVNMR